MKPRTSIVLAGVILVTLCLFLISFAAQPTSTSRRPWLEPRNPTRLEWLALEKQASEGDAEFGENGLTVHFYLGPKSLETGVIYCDLAYLPGTSAELVQLVEDGIRRRFDMERKVEPWARVEILKQVARR